jgi:hypothetical protein
MFAKANGLSQRFMAIFIPRLALIASKFAGGIGFVSATYFTGRESFSQKVGLIAGAVLATSVRVICEARWAHIDMLFGVFSLLTIYFGARSLLGTGGKRKILWPYVFMRVAVLTKELISLPVALVLVLGGSCPFFWSFAKAGRWRWSPRWPCSWRPSPWLLQSGFFPTSTTINRQGPFSMQVKSTVPTTSPLYIYADRMNDFNFYTERQKSSCELEKVREQAGAAYLLIEQRDLKLLSELGRKKCWLRIPSAATPGT